MVVNYRPDTGVLSLLMLLTAMPVITAKVVIGSQNCGPENEEGGEPTGVTAGGGTFTMPDPTGACATW